MNSSVSAPASASEMGEARIASSSPDLVCMSTTNGSIAANTSSRLVDDEVGALGDDRQVVVGDDRGDLDDHVAGVSSPVISRSIHTSTGRPYRWHDGVDGASGHATAPSYAGLLADDGVVERCALASRFGFMAYHGGGLEEMTEAIAAPPQSSGASLYAVVQPCGSAHFPSTSTAGRVGGAGQFLDHVDVVVTVHGFGRRGRFTSLLLGGRNRELARASVGRCVALPAYDIVTELEEIPRDCAALHPGNPVNLPAGAGCRSSCRRGCGGWGLEGRRPRWPTSWHPSRVVAREF